MDREDVRQTLRLPETVVMVFCLADVVSMGLSIFGTRVSGIICQPLQAKAYASDCVAFVFGWMITITA